MRNQRIFTAALILGMSLGIPLCANACTTIYIGSNHTSDGNTILARSEDYDSFYSKTFDVTPAGAHKKGEEYNGCYGFTWTFTHDSYSHTGFSDDTSEGVCPDCGGSHPHTPYQAAGTNEKGLTVTATETLYSAESALAADPFGENSIEEAEITTVLLSEAASAREALDLLISIIEEGGSANGSGILLADREESWYFENFTGTQYLAVQLNPDIVMINANTSALGKIDLDDTEHVIASDRLIETAIKAGTFVGDEKENIIDFASCFEKTWDQSKLNRITAGLNYLTGTEDFCSKDDKPLFDRTAYAITNIDQSGSITLPYTNIKPAKKYGLNDCIGFYRQVPISRTANVETHIFEIVPGDDTAAGTVEWIAMAEGQSTVFIPFYPMLTREVSPLLCDGQGSTVASKEDPKTPICEMLDDLYYTMPENWDQSMYWIFEAISFICNDDEDTADAIKEKLYSLQSAVMEDWEEMKRTVAAAGDDASKAATDCSIKITENVYRQALSILEEHPEYLDTAAAETEAETSSET